MTDLVIVGDQAYLPEEWAREERKRALARASEKRRRQRPEVRAKLLEYLREYNQRPEVRARKRQWMRDLRARQKLGRPVRVGSLHSLRCWGPHSWPRKGCKPIPMYRRPEDVAA